MAWVPLPQRLEDFIIRRKAPTDRLLTGRFSVRIARTVDEYRDAFRLLQSGYVAEGVVRAGTAPTMRITPHHLLPESTVYVAYEDGFPVGTLTTTIDSEALLPLDSSAPGLFTTTRAAGRRIAQLHSLSMVRMVRATGASLLLSGAAVGNTIRRGADYFVASSRPSSDRYYRAIWGMQSVAWERPKHSTLTRAEAQHRAARIEDLGPFLQRHFRSSIGRGQTFYDLNFGRCSSDVLMDYGPANDTEYANWKANSEVWTSIFRDEPGLCGRLSKEVRRHVCVNLMRSAEHRPVAHLCPVCQESSCTVCESEATVSTEFPGAAPDER